MAPFPLALAELFGHYGQYVVYLLIGVGFGWALEISGFADSPRLAAQFYFKDLTVLKVMFTAIIVAMVLIFAASALGLLDYNVIWVNPTYLWPGIVGGLIMGVGFIVGGFCPGTSLVSAVTGRLDGIFFTLGGLFGIFLFGETVGWYETWWNSSYLGRLTLPRWLGLDTGVVVVLVVLMALFMFWGGEQLERLFGGKDPRKAPRLRYVGAGALVVGALAVAFVGQPTTADKWAGMAPAKEQALVAREIQVHPGEVLAAGADQKLNLVLLDVRPEADFNLFHLRGAQHTPLETLAELVPELLLEPALNTVYVVMGNDEARAIDAYKLLTAESVPNVYVLEGGVNYWLELFALEEPGIAATPTPLMADQLRYTFSAALGDRYAAAHPDPHAWELEYTPKIKLQPKRGPTSGGCG
jgi:rhodanese-related sulfurtransferase